MAYDVKGNLIQRPKGQDIKPKAFKYSPTFMILHLSPLTDRYLLWMIAHYPYLFNIHFHEDIARISIKQLNNDSEFGKALQLMGDLKKRKLIKESKDGIKLKITLTGYLYRITSYPGFAAITSSLSILVTLFVFFFNRIFPIDTNKSTPLEIPSKLEKPLDSLQSRHLSPLDFLKEVYSKYYFF